MSTRSIPRLVQPDAEKLWEALRVDGCAIVEGVVPEPLIDRVGEELEPYFARTPTGEGTFYGYNTTRFSSIFAKSKATHDLATHPVLVDAIERILLPFCERIQINLTQAIRIQPGEGEQIPHRDDEMFPWAHPGAEFMINVLWALDDFAPGNGGTRIWPGTHLSPKPMLGPLIPDPVDAVPAEMPRGSAVVYTGSVIHAGGGNVTNMPRTGLVISYSLGWLRQAENQYLASPPEIARTFAPELRKLVGYTAHKPNLGWYEGQDPMILLEEQGRPDALPAKDLIPEEAEAAVAEFSKQWGEAFQAGR